MRINLPNQITIGRLILSIIFIALLSQYKFDDSHSRLLDWCVVVFVVAALTDWLDGYLARRKNQVTSLGRVLDPFVDKILVCGAFILLVGPGFVNAEGRNVTTIAPWMVILIVGRELLVSGLRGFSESQGQSFGADMSGKAKMWLQSTTAPLIILFVAHPQSLLLNPSVSWVLPVAVWLTVVVTVVSVVSYLSRSRHFLLEAA
ncbi:MAG: CDP-diacylglycerol--glycerol-3-phosphate 3-phosphatidyltransferase [Phycisphaerae bacterium]|nr:CDP-diacylglycerol--glycerol-3-phosphate 3-phosphatidyltransferase [Phycisphaerae bacterium]